MVHERFWRSQLRPKSRPCLAAPGRQAVSRPLPVAAAPGYLPEREIVIVIGSVAVRCPRVRDRVGEALNASASRRRFCLPTHAERSVDPNSPPEGLLYQRLRGALIARLGNEAGGLSAPTIGRLKEAWSPFAMT